MIGLTEAAMSFAFTRWRSRAGLSRRRFDALQSKALAHWLRNDLPKVAFYNAAPNVLSDLPIIDKATVMGQFDHFNKAGLGSDAAWDIQRTGGRSGDLTIGASTGTSGSRGLFVINEREKFRWLGAILAKTMADLLWRPQRVAILLPQDTGLYSSANRLRFVQLRTFSTMQPPDTWRAKLEAFAPTVIVAPPKILRHMAEHNFALHPERVFSAAETIDPVDVAPITAHFGADIRQIYMATEGLFAVSCAHGTLHLAEDSVAFEFEDAGGGLVSPLVTSFRRSTQIMARYRMNDLLRLADAPCPCGSPLRAVAEVVGRCDDMFQFQHQGRIIQITPDALRNAVLGGGAAITDFRLIQTAQDTIDLHLPPHLAGAVARAAQHRVQHLLDQFGATAKVALLQRDLPLETGRKLRRVQRQSNHQCGQHDGE